MEYVALLRGINVGKRRIKMADLRAGFASWGFENVTTIQAAGNVIFRRHETSPADLTNALEERLAERYGFEVSVLLRTMDEIRSLVESDPFRDVEVTPNTRLYVSFLPEKVESDLEIPYESPEKDFRILSAGDREVCSVLKLNPRMRTTDAMAILEQAFGSRLTTRNWNTVLKIVDASRSSE
jgi:uncharacterized protein (DUF1697 family)